MTVTGKTIGENIAGAVNRNPASGDTCPMEAPLEAPPEGRREIDMQLNGSEIVVECLKEQGVDTVFGYPGGSILNIYDALYKHSSEIRHILTSHEQGAAHAADGYARATGTSPFSPPA